MKYPAASAHDSGPTEALERALAHLHHVLPAQGPIGNFVHHNTLHAFQQLPFHAAIREASALHDGQGYLPEETYRAALRAGRIGEADVAYALALRAGEVRDEPLGPITRHQLERLLLLHGVALSAPPEQALYAACRRLAPLDPPPGAALLARLGVDRTQRDLLLALAARDPDELSNPLLIDFLGAYLDQGMARWRMPQRERGLLRAFTASLGVAPSALPPFQRRVLTRLRQSRGADSSADARAVALAALAELSVAPEHFASYLARMLLELPGFSGMVARLERFPRDREPGAPPASLLQLVALRLALDVEAYRECAREAGHAGPLSTLGEYAAARFARAPRDNRRNAERLVALCAHAQLPAASLSALNASFAQRACAWIEAFDADTRRRLLHEAYERAHLREVLDAFALQHFAGERAPEPAARPRVQALFCIDDREESLRRYFEELDPGHVSYGVAGFFGVAMRFRGIDDAAARSLCPVVIDPAHAIEEAPLSDHAELHARRFQRRNALARLRFELADASRSLLRGAVLTPLLGALATLPLTFRVLLPQLAARIATWFSSRVLPAPRTRLLLGRLAANEGDATRGFTTAEQAERVAGTLENIGLVRGFAPLIAVLGHGASSVNNPHHSAYDCGACGGRNGGPNARAFAAMANAPAVRALLRLRGIDIPDDSWFVGGYHDTTTDGVHLSDLELVPASLASELTALRAALERARGLSALERCRKFEHAPPTLSPEAALRHVAERAVDLSQARPELGHASNAVCVVGRRELSRGLFLDRRAFLVSYAAAIDPDLGILERVLGAVVPVCAGINLEYYFSTVDNDVWGAGTKLPHNLTGLLGVMEGASGDLRTGLPRQMIEVHDPVRLLTIIEAAPEAIMEVAARRPELAELVTHEWVRVASVHPCTGAIQVFVDGVFRPYAPSAHALCSVPSAEAWYRGQRGFLPPVRIAKERGRAA